MKMKIIPKGVAAIAVTLGMLIVAGAAHSTPLTPNLALDLQGQGLTLATGGVGLENLGNGTAMVTVTVGGTVEAAFLYWAGRDRPCPINGQICTIPSEPYLDQELIFDGTPITGTIIGTESQRIDGSGQSINNIGYRADVTSIVDAAGTGTLSFEIEDDDLS